MAYVADDGSGEQEIIWNSRDGVTPFVISLRSGKAATHANWHLDQYAPHYEPLEGDRIFVDLTRERALELAKANIARWASDGTSDKFGTIDAQVLADEYYDRGGKPDLIEWKPKHAGAEETSSAEVQQQLGLEGAHWAAEFCRIHNIVPGAIVPQAAALQDALRAWFANAIEAGITEGIRQEKARRAEQRRADVEKEVAGLRQGVERDAAGNTIVTVPATGRKVNLGNVDA